MNENEIVNLIQHFDAFSLDQAIAWYSNIDLNSELRYNFICKNFFRHIVRLITILIW